MNWKYRDEEAGGTLARMARSRGGFQNPWSVSSFAVTTMCLSCEKMQCSKTCSNKAWVKHVGGKARCPKKRDKFQTIKNIL